MFLTGRPDVDKAVSTVPDQLRGGSINTVVEKIEKEEQQVSETTSGKNVGTKEESEKDLEEEEEEDDDEEEEIPAKKSKIEGKIHELF